jgi:hypothetical protein
MSEFHEQLASDMRIVLAERIGAATMVETLSTRYDKVLGVMEEPDGRQFVSRSYSLGAEREFETSLHSPDLPFAEGFAAMQAMYQGARLNVVTSSVLPSRKGEPVTVISEYLPDAVSVREATLEAKQEAVKGLAQLLDPSTSYLPGSEAMVSDLFMFTVDEDGKQHPVVVDVDPRLQLKKPYGFGSGASSERLQDMIRGTYMTQVGSLIETFWAKDDKETEALARSFLAGMTAIHDESLYDGHATLEAMMQIHAMTQAALFGLHGQSGRY